MCQKAEERSREFVTVDCLMEGQCLELLLHSFHFHLFSRPRQHLPCMSTLEHLPTTQTYSQPPGDMAIVERHQPTRHVPALSAPQVTSQLPRGEWLSSLPVLLSLPLSQPATRLTVADHLTWLVCRPCFVLVEHTSTTSTHQSFSCISRCCGSHRDVYALPWVL